MHEPLSPESEENQKSSLHEMQERITALLEKAGVDENTWVDSENRPKGLTSLRIEEFRTFYKGLLTGEPQSWKRTEIVLKKVDADIGQIMTVAQLWLKSVEAHNEQVNAGHAMPLAKVVKMEKKQVQEIVTLYNELCEYGFERMYNFARRGDTEHPPDSKERELILALRVVFELDTTHENDRGFSSPSDRED